MKQEFLTRSHFDKSIPAGNEPCRKTNLLTLGIVLGVCSLFLSPDAASGKTRSPQAAATDVQKAPQTGKQQPAPQKAGGDETLDSAGSDADIPYIPQCGTYLVLDSEQDLGMDSACQFFISEKNLPTFTYNPA